MEDNINQIIRLALTGALLAIFVLWVFLRNVRLVLLVALAMPISIFTAFNFFLRLRYIHQQPDAYRYRTGCGDASGYLRGCA